MTTAAAREAGGCPRRALTRFKSRRTKPSPALTPPQKRFNTLIRQIEQARHVQFC
jgi:hypothetical protein